MAVLLLALERDELLLARDALLRLRVEAADLERGDFELVDFESVASLCRSSPLAPVDFGFEPEPEPLAEVPLRCPPRALDDLLLAIPILTHVGEDSFHSFMPEQ